jgi:hypothetical protein
MASLADLFASSQAPNVNQLRVQPVAYQRGGSKLGKAVGTVGDILAAIGGRSPVYESTMQGRENAYNQSMEKQQFQNVFRNFVENPNDPMVQANLAEVNPDAFLKVAPQNKVVGDSVVRMGAFGTPEVTLAGAGAGGSQPREVVIAKMLADPNTSPEVKARLEGMTAPPAPKPVYRATPGGGTAVIAPDGRVQEIIPGRAPAPRGAPQRQYKASDFQIIKTAEGQMRVNKITGEMFPVGSAPTSDSSALVSEARQLLPVATSGGLPAAAATAQSFVGIGTKAMEADERLNVIGARLVATVPRFEGPQSDKDTALYRQAAADVANPAKPRNVRLAALKTLEGLQQRAVARRPGAAPAQGGGKTIRFDAQGRRIP